MAAVCMAALASRAQQKKKNVKIDGSNVEKYSAFSVVKYEEGGSMLF
jgi:hexokinase